MLAPARFEMNQGVLQVLRNHLVTEGVDEFDHDRTWTGGLMARGPTW